MGGGVEVGVEVALMGIGIYVIDVELIVLVYVTYVT